MFINISYPILNSRFRKNLQDGISCGSNNPGEKPIVQKQTINNYCYRPIFTSREMSDEEFQRILKTIKTNLSNNPSLSGYSIEQIIKHVTKQNANFAKMLSLQPHIGQDKFRVILKVVNDENLEFAYTLFQDENYSTLKRNYPVILKNVNKENTPLAKKLIKTTQYNEANISHTLKYTTGNNLPIAMEICGIMNPAHVQDILKSANRDSIKAFGILCGDFYDNKKELPGNLAKFLPEKIKPKDIETIEKFYYSADNLYDEQKPNELVSSILYSLNSNNLPLIREYLNNKDMELSCFYCLFVNCNKYNVSLALDMIKDNSVPLVYKNIILEAAKNPKYAPIVSTLYEKKILSPLEIAESFQQESVSSETAKYFINNNTDKMLAAVSHQKNLFTKNPEKYLNGDIGNNKNLNKIVFEYNREIFCKNKIIAAVLADIMDKETLDVIFRKRKYRLDEYLKKVNKLSYDDLNLLKRAANSVNIDGKPLLPAQKIELLDIMHAYQNNGLATYNWLNMVNQGKIDIPNLNIELMRQFIKTIGINEQQMKEIPAKNLLLWDKNYISYLVQEYENGYDPEALKDVVKATLFDDFNTYIHDTENIHGEANMRTKELFEKYGINYHKWVHPPKSAEVKFISSDIQYETLKEYAKQITNDIEALRMTPAQNYIDKQLKHCIIDGKFVIPKSAMANSKELGTFTTGIINQLKRVWKHAETSLEEKDNILRAMAVLTVRNHLLQKLEDISQLTNDSKKNLLNITIKMWDRIPQKDLFQGNYSTCCIGMGQSSGYAISTYLLNTAFNMIELVDNDSGETIGNSLCYFTKDKNSKVALFLDNIEIRNNIKLNKEIDIQLRNAIAEYAKNIAKEVTGKNDIPIYLGSYLNDITTDDLKNSNIPLQFMGFLSCLNSYSDVFFSSMYNETEEDVDVCRLG